MSHRAGGDEGFILHARPWRDTSLLLEVLLKEGGRCGVVARGARSNAKQRGRLQLFRPLWLELGGRGELAQLRTAEEMRILPPLQGRALACAYYLNELLLRLLPREDAHPALFDAYAAALTSLAQGEAEAPLLRGFEKDLLEQLGWAPEWTTTLHGETVLAEGFYRVSPGEGIVACLPQDAHAVPGLSLLHLAELRMNDAQSARQIRQILHGLLAPHLGSKPLQSRELLRVLL
ncbi:MAG: DNA repair protein RecO [Pseudomonadota bacterium]